MKRSDGVPVADVAPLGRVRQHVLPGRDEGLRSRVPTHLEHPETMV
jgi:hypothetical protein